MPSTESNTKHEGARSEAGRKRQARERTGNLYKQLEELVNSQSHVLAEHEIDIQGKGRAVTMEKLICMLEIFKNEDADKQSSMKIYRQGMVASTMTGTLLVRTSDLQVLESSKAMNNFWMLAEEGRRNLVGQSLWNIVYWDDHGQVEEIQKMCMRRECSSVLGKIFPLLFLRMTNDSRNGGLAKVVRRRLQVLHLTPDGTTALLGIDVEQEDMRALEVDDHQREILGRGDQVFQLQMMPGSKTSTTAQASIPRSGASFTNFENIVQAMARYAPRLYMVLGPDKEGILRHMGLSRIWSGSADYPVLESTPVHVPLYNIRIGDFKINDNDAAGGGAQDFMTKDIAWMGWFIPGDDDNSKKFPFESDVTNCCSFLCCFFKQWPMQSAPGVSMGYFHPAQDGLVFSNRRGMDNGHEPRPLISHGAPHGLHSVWDGMDIDVPEMIKIFKIFEGTRQFYDTGEVIEGVWVNSNPAVSSYRYF